MAHIDNRSVLQFAHVTLLGLGIEILDSVKVKGHDLAVTPIGKRTDGVKHEAITFTLLKNGKPSTAEEAMHSAAQQISKIVERRHPSERNSLDVAGLTLTMKADFLKAEAARREKLRKLKENRPQPGTEHLMRKGPGVGEKLKPIAPPATGGEGDEENTNGGEQ